MKEIAGSWRGTQNPDQHLGLTDWSTWRSSGRSKLLAHSRITGTEDTEIKQGDPAVLSPLRDKEKSPVNIPEPTSDKTKIS